jgi:4-diphosphocytidyl-2-C-methyl-D-erythritol kinase
MSEQFTKVGEGLLVRAPGKINLSLLVKGKRADGYHDIESIMAKIDWYDEILIEHGKSDTAGQGTEDGGQKNVQYPIPNVECPSETIVELICKGEYKVPEGEGNLVYKAAEEILKIKNKKAKSNEERNKRLKITLTKHIPAGSGLGSGSSDAAATLMGINKFLRMDLGQKELARLAAKLGSDVAFFLNGPMALCTGRGEKIKKLEESEFRVFLVVPDVSISTKRVYENYRHDEVKYRRLSEEINIYIEKKRIDLICGMCANMLEESCFEMHPELGVLKKKIESLGIRPVGLSGSGSSMFCIINNRNEEGVKTYRDKLEQELGCKSYIVNNNSW